jgi:hypothetical protein
VFRVEGETGAAGTYEIAVEVASRKNVYGRAAATASAAWPQEEFRAPGLNRDALSAFVARHGGTLLELGDDGETARALEAALSGLAARTESAREEARPLSEDPRAFLVFLALLAGEWILRRRSGMD